jgi:hypothetical protein
MQAMVEERADEVRTKKPQVHRQTDRQTETDKQTGMQAMVEERAEEVRTEEPQVHRQTDRQTDR